MLLILRLCLKSVPGYSSLYYYEDIQLFIA